jgi:hypothetical protein
MAPAILARVSSDGMVCPLFDVALGHSLLQPVISDGFADVHTAKKFRCSFRGCCIVTRVAPSGKQNLQGSNPFGNAEFRSDTRDAEISTARSGFYFFSVVARNSTVRFQASAASAGR